MDFAFFQLERHVVVCLDAGKLLGNIQHFNDVIRRVVHPHAPFLRFLNKTVWNLNPVDFIITFTDKKGKKNRFFQRNPVVFFAKFRRQENQNSIPLRLKSVRPDEEKPVETRRNNGQTGARQRIVDWTPLLYHVACGLLSDESDREDAVQSAIEKAWRRIPCGNRTS